MRITVKQLRRIISEEAEQAVKTGKEKADTKGTLDVKTIATTLGVDPGKFAEAVKAAKSGNRSSGHNAILGDVFVKLMEASPEDTVKVMNVLKKITSDKKVDESIKRKRNTLLESYSRITEKEMSEWKKGNWGYVSEGDEISSDDPNRFLHGYEEDSPMDDEGNMIKGRMAGLKRMAEEICELTQDDDQFPAWVQDLVAQAHETLSHVHDYLLNDEDMRDYSDSVGYEGDSPLEIASEAKKDGPSKKTARKILRGTKTFKDKMKKVEKWADDPAAAAGWMMKKAGYKK